MARIEWQAAAGMGRLQGPPATGKTGRGAESGQLLFPRTSRPKGSLHPPGSELVVEGHHVGLEETRVVIRHHTIEVGPAS